MNISKLWHKEEETKMSVKEVINKELQGLVSEMSAKDQQENIITELTAKLSSDELSIDDEMQTKKELREAQERLVVLKERVSRKLLTEDDLKNYHTMLSNEMLDETEPLRMEAYELMQQYTESVVKYNQAKNKANDEANSVFWSLQQYSQQSQDTRDMFSRAYSIDYGDFYLNETAADMQRKLKNDKPVVRHK